MLEVTLSDEQVRDQRIQAERDFYSSPVNFIDYIRDFGAAPDAIDKPHGEGARWIMDWKTRPNPDNPDMPLFLFKMLLWPRGSFKSHAFDIGLATWLIATNSNIRILVASETAKQAKVFVGLAMEIVASEKFKELFGVHDAGRYYKGQGFWSSARTQFLKEPTLWATGVEQVQTGMHWDWVIGDDIVSQENTNTPEAIEGTKQWLGETLAQLDPGCKLLLIGTRHHYADVYGWILKEPERRAMFEVSIHKWRNPDGSLFFPGRLTEAFVMGQKALMPIRQWAAYYENDPATSEERIFLPEYFHVIPDDDVPSAVWTYILTDFAFKAKEKKSNRSDRTCFWVVSIDHNRTCYVLDFWVGREKPSDTVRRCCAFWDQYQDRYMKGIAVEDTTHKEVLAGLFEEIRRETFVKPRIIPIGGRSQEIKDLRIEAAEPRFRSGRIYFTQSLRNDHRKWNPMIEEMTEWPFSSHDDVPDAISDIDKKDGKDCFYLRQPPINFDPWRKAELPVPSQIDGMLNPQARYDPRRMLRRLQQKGNSIWQQEDARLGQPAQTDLFQRHVPRPSLWNRRL